MLISCSGSTTPSRTFLRKSGLFESLRLNIKDLYLTFCAPFEGPHFSNNTDSTVTATRIGSEALTISTRSSSASPETLDKASWRSSLILSRVASLDLIIVVSFGGVAELDENFFVPENGFTSLADFSTLTLAARSVFSFLTSFCAFFILSDFDVPFLSFLSALTVSPFSTFTEGLFCIFPGLDLSPLADSTLPSAPPFLFLLVSLIIMPFHISIRSTAKARIVFLGCFVRTLRCFPT
ncbi:hypothetical protein V8G54_007650 [Vigna mungo]|uniref:Uncharacterized protein n=1 Tax=Vigna mungo TaxID=3915 RepID=A0AAQ3S8G3_VIGMU